MPAVPWLQHVGQARDSGEIEQREPISIAFVGTVRAVTLSSTGSLWCSGFHGRMVGFRDGTEVVRADNVLIDPSDCALDDVTYGVHGELPPEVDIDSLVIEGVDPWVAPVLGECCGRALLKYTVLYQPPGVACNSVTRGQVATCQITGSVDSVSGWEFKGVIAPKIAFQDDTVRVTSASAAITWSGTAVLSGTVSAFVSTGGALDTLSGQLIVTGRSGPGWRWDEAKWQFHQDGPVLCAYGAFEMPFPPPNPGRLAVNRRTSGCVPEFQFALRIAPYVVTAPDSGFSADSIEGGPNDGLWYVVEVHYYMDRTTETNPFVRPGGPTRTLTNSTDQRVCRQALGLGNNDPVVVNFFTYNSTCRSFSLTPMFDGVWAHEGFGTKNPLDSATANGHEARARIAARDPRNDPYRMVEPYVNISYDYLKFVVTDSVYAADNRITDFSNDHAFVKDNYRQNNRCGEAWIFDTTVARYTKIRVTQAGGQCI